jgi:phospholipid transport system substrate-binding protein
MRPFAWLCLLFAAAASGGLQTAAQAEDAGAPATARSLCDALLASMKRGPSLDFSGRRDLLAPEIKRDFDLPFMTRLVVGPPWQGIAAGDRQSLVDAFSAYSVGTYAQQFKSYSGERFEVDPSPAPQARGDCIVHTKLFTADPQPVQLDYLMRKAADRWVIIDVYLNGTISEMAARRSEYSTILRQGGAPALVDLLRKKEADFENQRPGSS